MIGAYPGRGVIAGTTDEGVSFQGYWLTGRSEASRARRLVIAGDDLRVVPSAAAPDHRSPYLAYPAILTRAAGWVVANGDHSVALVERLSSERRLAAAIGSLDYEDDPPIFTPRVAVIGRTADPATVVFVKVARAADASTKRSTYRIGPIRPGSAWVLQTYAGGETRPTTFEGDPYRIDALEGLDAIAAAVWESLDPRFRVALAVCIRDPADHRARWSLLHDRDESPAP